jgi:AcrR family transcriptional regulator
MAKASRKSGEDEQAKAGVSRRTGQEARRQAILDAALTEFAERGFEAARLDDIAARAGVAKGTLYLYFDDKEKLFEALIRNAVDPIIGRLDALAEAQNLPVEEVLGALFSTFENEVLGTKRKLLMRLLIAEGPRFPAIAEFHYRNVVSRIMPLIRKVAERAVERGEFSTDAAARFPQLIAAPLITAVIWDALFSRIEPLDAGALFRAHLEILTCAPGRTPK